MMPLVEIRGRFLLVLGMMNVLLVSMIVFLLIAHALSIAIVHLIILVLLLFILHFHCVVLLEIFVLYVCTSLIVTGQAILVIMMMVRSWLEDHLVVQRIIHLAMVHRDSI